jgi:hypothetical protein
MQTLRGKDVQILNVKPVALEAIKGTSGVKLATLDHFEINKCVWPITIKYFFQVKDVRR